MTMGFDDATPVTLAGVVEQQMNGALPLTTPDKASQLTEVVPYYSSRGAFTADQSMAPFMRIQSDDVSVTPKSFSLPIISGGPAALMNVVGNPPLQAMPLNIDLSQTRSARINYFVNDQTDVTVEPAVGCTVVYDTDPVSMPEIFYQKPANEFATGTADGERTTSVAALTITGGREIISLICQVFPNAMALSEQLFGFMEFSSSDFLTSMPYRVAFNPVHMGIGEANAIGSSNSGAGIKIYNMPIGKGIPIAGRTVIDEAVTIFDGYAAAGGAVGGVGYIK